MEENVKGTQRFWFTESDTPSVEESGVADTVGGCSGVMAWRSSWATASESAEHVSKLLCSGKPCLPVLACFAGEGGSSASPARLAVGLALGGIVHRLYVIRNGVEELGRGRMQIGMVKSTAFFLKGDGH